MVTLISGLTGGLVATIVMTLFMRLLGDDTPPPTAIVWSRYIGGGPPEDYQQQGMVLHLLYGIVAGGVFALAVPVLGSASVPTIGSALLWGLGYGVLLFLGAAVFWMKVVLGINPEPRMAAVFLVSHLIFGAVLGGWVGSGGIL